MLPWACSGINHSLPNMSILALPPHHLIAAGCNHLGCQRFVKCWMPLLRNSRISCSKIVKSCQYFSSCTIRTAGFQPCTSARGRFPRMPLLTLPPDLSVAVGQHSLRRQSVILFRMPLLCQFRKYRGKVILSWDDHLSCTYRATFISRCSGSDARKPLMSLFALPPNFTQCTGKNLFRR